MEEGNNLVEHEGVKGRGDREEVRDLAGCEEAKGLVEHEEAMVHEGDNGDQRDVAVKVREVGGNDRESIPDLFQGEDKFPEAQNGAHVL